MTTTIDNNLRVFTVRTSLGRQYFCNLHQLNEVVKHDGSHPGYFKIFHFWNGTPKLVSKKYLREMADANGIKIEFNY